MATILIHGQTTTTKSASVAYSCFAPKMTLKIILCACAVLLQACGTTLRVATTVNSYGNDENLRSKRYVLYSGDKNVDEDDLEFVEYARYLRYILARKGYEEVTDSRNADLSISFSYGISDPQVHEYTVNVPTWGETGVSSSKTTGTMSYNSFTQQISYSENTTYEPSYGITGSKTITRRYTDYTRYILVVAFNRSNKSVWQTWLKSTGKSNNLRMIIPYMIYAGIFYFGSSSGEQVSHDVDEENLLQFKQAVMYWDEY